MNKVQWAERSIWGVRVQVMVEPMRTEPTRRWSFWARARVEQSLLVGGAIAGRVADLPVKAVTVVYVRNMGDTTWLSVEVRIRGGAPHKWARVLSADTERDISGVLGNLRSWVLARNALYTQLPMFPDQEQGV